MTSRDSGGWNVLFDACGARRTCRAGGRPDAAAALPPPALT